MRQRRHLATFDMEAQFSLGEYFLEKLMVNPGIWINRPNENQCLSMGNLIFSEAEPLRVEIQRGTRLLSGTPKRLEVS